MIFGVSFDGKFLDDLTLSSKADLPSIPAIYVIHTEAQLIYVGQTRNLRKRFCHKDHKVWKCLQRKGYSPLNVSIAYLPFDERHKANPFYEQFRDSWLQTYESYFIEKLKPILNKRTENRSRVVKCSGEPIKIVTEP